jgi:hypothetical protein
MYKNFNLTDEERKEIMEQHVSHGYGKPLNEDAMRMESGLSLPGGVERIFKQYGFEVMDRTMYASTETGYSLVWDNNIPSFDISFNGGILRLTTKEFTPLKYNLKSSYTFEFNNGDMDFELGLLSDFLGRVANILLQNSTSSKVDMDDNPHLEPEGRTFRSMMGGTDGG